MARQCWDEARHVEIACVLDDHMGTDIGEFCESVTLFEAACHPDPAFRLAGVNRALEGLAIDVFTTIREFGNRPRRSGDVLLRGLDARRRSHPRAHGFEVAPRDHRQRQGASERRRSRSNAPSTACSTSAVGAARTATRPIRLARTFREMAGFDTAEIDEIAAMARADRAAREAAVAAIAVTPNG